MRSLRDKLLLSHALLVLGILLVGSWSIYHFEVLGRSVRLILRNNYRSVVDAQGMKEALERQDSAMLFQIAGRQDQSSRQYNPNRERFARLYADAAANITEAGEPQIIHDIGEEFAAYTRSAEAFLANPDLPPQVQQQIYFRYLEPAFRALKNRCDDLLRLNQEAMVRGQDRAEGEAAAARNTAVLIAAGSLLLGAVYAVNLSSALVAPLRRLARVAERIGEGKFDERIAVTTRDEVGVLASAFNRMMERLRSYRDREAARLQVAEEKSDAVLNSLYEPVIVTGPQGDLISMNEAARALFGAEEYWLNQSVDSLGAPAVSGAIEEATSRRVPVALDGERGIAIITVEHTERAYRVRTAPVLRESGEVAGTVTVLEDITRLRQMDRVKDEFISVASHELRTPLTSLQMAVSLLAEGAGGPLSADQTRLVHIAVTDAERLNRLATDLLDLNRLEAGTTVLQRRPVQPRDLIEAALQPLLLKAREQGISLVTRVDSSMGIVSADFNQIVRVVTNLMENAIRNTPRGGRVEVSSRVVGSMVEFAVADTGAGIPPRYLARVFDRFVQIPGTTPGGAGLGLPIARLLIEAHGGTITAEPTPGGGATFRFTIPMSSSPASDKTAAHGEASTRGEAS